MDGVFVDYGKTFYPTPGLEDEEVAAILHEITEQIEAYLQKQGITVGEMAEGQALEDALADMSGASILRKVARGKRRGSRVRTDGTLPSLYVLPDPNVMTHKGRRCVHYRGFSLHANVAIKQGDQKGLAQLT